MSMQRYLLLAMAGLAISLGGHVIPARADVSAKEVGRNVTQAAESGATYAIQERDKYIRKAQREIDELRAGIDKLGLKARTARDEAKAKLDKDIASLDRKRDAAESRLDDVKSANASAWKHLKAGMDSALEDLKQSFAKARKEFD
jgi:predicted  nucleic acid-binding Zn-ribbon protein